MIRRLGSTLLLLTSQCNTNADKNSGCVSVVGRAKKRSYLRRVANVIEEGKLGGPQVRIVRVAAALQGQIETLVCMPSTNSRGFRELCAANSIPYHTLALTRITKEWRAAFGYVLFSPFEVVRLSRLFRREGIELVHVSGGSWQFKGVIAARLAGVPSVWHLNDTSMPGWLRALFRLVQPLASGFIFASERSRDYYGGLIGGQRPEAVVPSTVDLAHFDSAAAVDGDEEIVAGFGDTPVIGTVANVNPIKGIELLIRAASLLRKQYPELRVAVVGPVFANQQRYSEQLVQLAGELDVAVDWLGARSDVRPLLRRFDVYVCSSLAESSPVSVWEAMAMAKPVVSTDVGDVARHVVDGESGFVVPVGDAEAMAERIGELLDDPGRRSQMGRAAREAASVFSPDAIAARTLDIYERVVAWQPSDPGNETHTNSSKKKI